MPAEPFVTVVVAVLNGAATLPACLASIDAQTYRRCETLVMDGASTDGTLDILHTWHPRCGRWESRPDRGIYQAWNRALDRASGDWICFLGADDRFWDRHALTRLQGQLAAAVQDGIRVVYGRALKCDARGRVVRRSGRPWSQIGWQMRHGMPLIHAGVFHHRDLFAEHGRFDPQYRIAGDYEFLLRELIHRTARFAPGPPVVIHGAGGLSDRRNLETHIEIARARRRHGLPPLSPVWAMVFGRALVRAAWRRLSPGTGQAPCQGASDERR